MERKKAVEGESIESAAAQERDPIEGLHEDGADLFRLERRALEDPVNLSALSALHAAYEQAGRKEQAARALSLMQQQVGGKLSEYHRENGKYILVKPAAAITEQDKQRHIPLAFDGEGDFLAGSLQKLLLYLKQPETIGVILDSSILASAGSAALLMISMANSEHKEVRFEGAAAMDVAGIKSAIESAIRTPDHTASDFPVEYSIIPGIGQCNLRCRFCRHSEQKIQSEVMAWDVFEAAVDNIPQRGNIKVSLTPHTEPMLLDGFMDMIRYAVKERPEASVGFNTNGTLFNERKLIELIESGVKYVHFSMNVGNREDFKWFAGVDLYDKLCDNVRLLHTLRERLGSITPKIHLQMLKMPVNDGKYDEFSRTWGDIADKLYFRNVSVDASGEVDIDKKTGTGDLQAFIRSEYACHSMWMAVAVNWKGLIYPCCSMANQKVPLKETHALCLGDIRKDRIADIWNGEAMLELRLQQMTGIISPCDTCRVYRQPGEEKILSIQESIRQRYYGGRRH